MAVAALCFTLLLCTFQAKLTESRLHNRIVNGFVAKPGQFPFQISLYKDGTQDCGGSILNENYVLTAAHCVSGNTIDQQQVIAGTVNLDDLGETGSIHNVTEIIVHEQYDESDSWINDIALLKVNPPFKFNNNLAPIKLPAEDEELEVSNLGVISGFGLLGRNLVASRQLLFTYVYVVPPNVCEEVYKDDNQTIRPTNICIGNTTSVTGFCQGDSGGPLHADGKQFGIVSFSLYGGCATDESKHPQVSTRVTSYLDWIEEHTDDNNST